MYTPGYKSIQAPHQTQSLQNMQQRSAEHAGQLSTVRKNDSFMRAMKLVFEHCDPVSIAKLIKYNGFGGRMSSITLEECCHNNPSVADEIKKFDLNFLEKPLFSSGFYLKSREAEILLKICNFGVSEDDKVTVEKIKELKSLLFIDDIGTVEEINELESQLDNTYSNLENAIATQTNGRLDINKTAVIKLSGAVGAKKGMLVCAPSYGQDRLKRYYYDIFQTAVNNGAKTLAIPAFNAGKDSYRHDEAAFVAILIARDFLNNRPAGFLKIVFVVYQNEDETECDEPSVDGFERALEYYGINNDRKPLLCVKSQIQHYPADMVVIPVGENFQPRGTVYQAIDSAFSQTELCVPTTTRIFASTYLKDC